MSPRFAYSRLRPLLYDPIRRMRRRRTRRATPRRLALEPLESRFLLTEFSGHIVDHAIWDNGVEPYVLSGDLFIDPGASLTIVRGVEVRTVNRDHDIFIDGHLEANGADFTGNDTEIAVRDGGELEMSGDSTIDGDAWNRVESGGRADLTDVRFLGENRGRLRYEMGSSGSVTNAGGNWELEVHTDQVNVQDSTINWVTVSETGAPTMTGNTFTGDYPLRLTDPDGDLSGITGNTYTAATPGIHVGGTADSTYRALGFEEGIGRYRLMNSLTIAAGCTLSLAPGLQLERDYWQHVIHVDGRLEANDVDFAGWWYVDIVVHSGGRFVAWDDTTIEGGSVRVEDAGRADLTDVRFLEVVGGNPARVLYETGSAGSVTNADGNWELEIRSDRVSVQHSTINWIEVTETGAPTVTSNTFTDGHPFRMADPDADVSGIAGNTYPVEAPAIRMGGKMDSATGTLGFVDGIGIYHLVGELTVATGCTLTLAPGVQVENTHGQYEIYVEGRLEANDVDFTGSWVEIVVRNGGEFIAAGGTTIEGGNDWNRVENGGRADLTDVHLVGVAGVENEKPVKFVYETGSVGSVTNAGGNWELEIQSDQVTVRDSTIDWLTVSRNGAPSVTGNTITHDHPLRLTDPDADLSGIAGNTYTAAAPKILVSGVADGPTRTLGHVDEIGSYRLRGDLTVAAGGTLILAPGVQLETAAWQHNIYVDGHLEAKDVDFTGSWTEIVVRNGGRLVASGETTFDVGGIWSRVESGGRADFVNVHFVGAPVRWQYAAGATGKLNSCWGSIEVALHSSSDVSVANCDFSDAHVFLEGNGAATVDVTGNHWGSSLQFIGATGLDHAIFPIHPGDLPPDPSQAESRITDRMDDADRPRALYDPMLTLSPRRFTGFYVTGHRPNQDISGSPGRIEVSFNRIPDPATLTADNIEIAGPLGTVNINRVSTVNDYTYAVEFEPPTEPGVYHFAVSAAVTDSEGNPLNQDLDGTPGEQSDAYEATVTLVGVASEIARDDSLTTDEDVSFAIPWATLLANDAPDADWHFHGVSDPVHATVTNRPDTQDVLFVPEADFFGEASFLYALSNGQGDSATATVTVDVTSVNDPPTAADIAVSTDENSDKAITLTATDIDSDMLTFTIVTPPAHGELTGTAPDLTYAPESDFSGTDVFTFKASDGQADSNVASVTVMVTPVHTALCVTDLTPAASGLSLTVNRPADAIDLNLYDGASQTLGPADVTLVGATTGPVRGSLVLSDGERRITFVRSGEPLAPDTYTLTLRSATNGFRDAAGELLDGNGDGMPGDDYVADFAIPLSPLSEVLISLPDFARGFGQAANVPASTNTGIPVSLSTGQDVSSVDFDLQYNPALLTITGFSTNIPGAAAAYNVVRPGLAKFTVSSATEFSSSPGAIELGRIEAQVPDAASYASKHVLDLTNVLVYDNDPDIPQPRPARDDDGIHIAAYFGDVNASRSYTGGDVTLLQRAIVGLGSGFTSFQLADPLLISDLNHSGSLTGGDTTLLQRAVVGILVSSVPPLPAGIVPAPPDGADPRVFIPTDLIGQASETVTVPVNLTVTEPAGITISSVDLVIGYDASRFSPGDFRLGSLLEGAGFSAPLVNSTPGIIRATMSTVGATPLLTLGTTGSLLLIDFMVNTGAPTGPSPINLRADFSDGVSRTSTNLTDRDIAQLVLNSAPTNVDSDPVDGLFTIVQPLTVHTPWHNTANPFDVAGEGTVTPQDVLILINYINSHPGDGSLPDPSGSPPPPPYYDVNNDERCTPLDVLLAINHINGQIVGLSEGEALQSPPPVLATKQSSLMPSIVSLPRLARYVTSTAIEANAQQSGGDEQAIWIPPTGKQAEIDTPGSTERIRHATANRFWDDDALNDLDAAFAGLNAILPDISDEIESLWNDG
ncbi:MAG: tandem-95 repeat protein [Planctomycetes bacterium]|nr:tandem-95 repeat protein [Planctomycetota bacterium]MBL7040407.1 tandem-95 repeat protein [Pirellulaceae bacterium]